MISLKQYLDSAPPQSKPPIPQETRALLPAVVGAYRSALLGMGNCGQDACPALGEELQRELGRLGEKLAPELSSEEVRETERGVAEELANWGRRASLHYREKTGEVKQILLVMAQAAQSVGERDQRCATQITEVTARLKGIANLEDLSDIRALIEQSASDLKTSIDRMTAEGNAAIDQLRKEVSTYQTRLEEAEQIAARDSLTGLGNRLWVEGQMERALRSGTPLCVAILDIDGFKQVNDSLGHLAGDELLKQFAGELRSASRKTDVVGRWGGDEFLILLDCNLADAQAQTDRLRAWVCGNYTLELNSGAKKLRVEASIGLAEHVAGESMKELVERADAAMYRNKATSRKGGNGRR
jgi:diguanylate cyclase (GGDEF)-like protein